MIGARWYFFRRVFHDWSDDACRKILVKTREAMRKGYSTLLIQDSVIPETGCSPVNNLIDLGMAIIAGMERTEVQWRKLLGAEGFNIIKIWPAQIGSLSMIEAEII